MTGGNRESGLNLRGQERGSMVHDLLNAEFKTTKKRDDGEEDNRDEIDRAYFCVNCRGRTLTKSEVAEFHRDHYVLRAMKCSGSYGYVIKDIEPLFEDLSGVYEYKINQHYLYFPKSREKYHDKQTNYNKIHGNCCAKCKHILLKSGFLFCSIDCKLTCPNDVLQQHLEWMKLKQNQVRLPVAKKTKIAGKEMTEESNKIKKQKVSIDVDLKGLVTVAMKEADGKKLRTDCSHTYRKRSRKGIPHRAPLY